MKKLYLLIMFILVSLMMNTSKADILTKIDLNDNQCPEDWLLTSNGNAGIMDAKLIAKPTDSYVIISTSVLPVSITEIILEYDGRIEESFWGNTLRAGINLTSGYSYVFQNGYYEKGTGDKFQAVIREFKTPYSLTNTVELNQEILSNVYSYSSDIYHYNLTIKENTTKFKAVNTSTNTILLDEEFQNIDQLSLESVQSIFFIVKTTTEATPWMDNIQVTIKTKNTEEILSKSVNGKVVTAHEILGYSANVGGATINASNYGVSTTTNIYGEFELQNIPIGECIIEIESSYFETLTKLIKVNPGVNNIEDIEIFKPKCLNMKTQEEVDKLVEQIKTERDAIILEKDNTIKQLNTSIASMYTQGYLDNAIIEAEKRGELKYDINLDGKVGLEEIIRYLETLSGVRIESLIIFPDDKNIFLNE